MGCQPSIAKKILGKGVDHVQALRLKYLLAAVIHFSLSEKNNQI